MDAQQQTTGKPLGTTDVVEIGEHLLIFIAILSLFSVVVWAAAEGAHKMFPKVKKIWVAGALGPFIGMAVRLFLDTPIPDSPAPLWVDWLAVMGFAAIAGFAVCTGGAKVINDQIAQRIKQFTKR